jgi:hypothetical protein
MGIILGLLDGIISLTLALAIMKEAIENLSEFYFWKRRAI